MNRINPHDSVIVTYLDLSGLAQFLDLLDGLVERHPGEEPVRPVLHPGHQQVQVTPLVAAAGELQVRERLLHYTDAARAAQTVPVQFRLRPRDALLLRLGISSIIWNVRCIMCINSASIVKFE